MKFSSLSIKTRILSILVLLAVAMVAVGALGLSGMNDTVVALDSMYQRRVKVVGTLGELRMQELDRQTLLAMTVLADNPAEIARIRAERATIKARAEELLKEYVDQQQSVEGKALAQGISEAHAGMQASIDAVDAALNANDISLARKLMSKVDDNTDVLQTALAGTSAQMFKRAEEALVTAQGEFRTSRNVVIAAMIVSVSVAAFLGMLLLRSIMSGLASAVKIADQIANGQLGHEIRIDSAGELGALLRSLQQMDSKLHQIVGSVRGVASAVGGAAGQLSRGNDDLSQRTQEQASALEETASSMEEMTATVKQNADNARQANQLASGARGQAEKGGAVVQRAVSAMQEINGSSRKIADIISVIDEIAFQTNLLALNAAVEAARAGEMGRGFAVVASEVRSLAQRSATAAKEIKELINDSVEKVQAGTGLVDESGKVLAEIMDSVKKVSDIVAEIAAASEEQASGIEQVNNAVTQMDDTTQQNAALVEEAASAAKSMEQQTQQLVTEIGFFRSAAEASENHSVAVARPVVHTPARVVAKPTARPAARRVTKPVRATSGQAAPLARASGDDSAWQEF